MAITFNKEKKQKNLLLIAGFLIIIALAVAWWGFSGKTPDPVVGSEQIATFKAIEIDFSLLEKEAIKNLRLLSDIEIFQGETGRKNPFIPY